MTARSCGACGADIGAPARFCGGCGNALPAPLGMPAGATADPSGGAPHAQPDAPELHGPPAAEAWGAPDGWAATPAPGPYGGAPSGGPWSGAPYGGTPHAWGQAPNGWQPAPAGNAWSQVPPVAPTPGRRSGLDAFLSGDWGGAARAAGLAVAAMAVISLAGVLLVSGAGAGFRETVVLVFGAVCAAMGGDVVADASGGELVGGSVSIGVLPLTVTFAGLGVLGWRFAVRLRARGTTSNRDVLLQGIRTTAVLAGLLLVLSLLTRYRTDSADQVLGVSGRIGVSVRSTVVGAVLFSAMTLGLVWLSSRRTELPGRLRAVRDGSRAPLLGAAAVFAAGLLAVVVALVYGLVRGDERAVQLGLAVLGAGNGAAAGVLLAAAVPLGVEGGLGSSVLGGAGGTSRSVDLFTFADASAWFWLAPVVLLGTVLAVATVLALRQNSVEDARRESLRFAGALAVLGFGAALLLRISVTSSATTFGVGSSGTAAAVFNPFLATFVLAIWGVVLGLLAPAVASRTSGRLVSAVRRWFGAAPAGPVG